MEWNSQLGADRQNADVLTFYSETGGLAPPESLQDRRTRSFSGAKKAQVSWAPIVSLQVGKNPTVSKQMPNILAPSPAEE